MKSLNKKISAIVLASMVVMGGIVSSGVSSFAASAKNVSVQVNHHQYKQVNFYSKENGQIIGLDKDENNLKEKYDKEKCYNKGRSVSIKYPSQISGHLFKAQYKGYKFVKIKFGDFYYLIKIK